MRRALPILLPLLLLTVGEARAQARPVLSIDRIEARLYHHGLGKFSGVIPADAPLHNTMIGEGWAEDPAEAVFVVVIVKGRDPDNQSSDVQLDVVNARSGKRIVQDKAPIGFLRESETESRVGFWIRETCAPLKLSAALSTRTADKQGNFGKPVLGKPVTATLPFQCGE